MKSDRDLEHPDVSAIERTGYARGHEPKALHFCSECGDPIFVGDYALRVPGWGWICEDCVHDGMEEISE